MTLWMNVLSPILSITGIACLSFGLTHTLLFYVLGKREFSTPQSILMFMIYAVSLVLMGSLAHAALGHIGFLDPVIGAALILLFIQAVIGTRVYLRMKPSSTPPGAEW